MGGELNAVIKDKADVDVRFAFCFPDVYEVGMSHLGMKTLYSVLNEQSPIFGANVFAPWVDMEEEMRKHDIPLLLWKAATVSPNLTYWLHCSMN